MAQQSLPVSSLFSLGSIRYREVEEQEEEEEGNDNLAIDDVLTDEDREIVTVSFNVEAKDASRKDATTPESTKPPSPACSADDLSDDFTDDDFDDTTHKTRCQRFQRSGVCSLTLYLWISVFVVGCFIALVVVGVLVVGPYRRAASFVATVCNTSGFFYPPEEHHCACGKGCTSLYPCLEVTVTFLDGKGKPHLAALHDTESSLDRECSYYPPCKSSKMANEKAVRDYEHMYGQPGKKFTCLYNPKNPTEVIRTRRFHLNHVIHGMVWSSLVFILSLVILIVAIRKKGCDFL